MSFRISKKTTILFILIMIIAAISSGCNNMPEKPPISDNENTPETTYEDIEAIIVSGAEAREVFESHSQVILLDVRNQDEFDAFSIPNSTLIPVDELESRLSELPDKDADIIVFCRAGRRSAIAADILISNGYTNVYDMGSINNWG